MKDGTPYPFASGPVDNGYKLPINREQQEDNTFKQKSKWTEVNDKPFNVGLLREITDLYESGEISYGRMVELLNEIAIKWYNK